MTGLFISDMARLFAEESRVRKARMRNRCYFATPFRDFMKASSASLLSFGSVPESPTMIFPKIERSLPPLDTLGVGRSTK